MASRDRAAMVQPRARRSIAYMPPRTSSGVDKENATTDIGAIRRGTVSAKTMARDRKSRSKSLGPGGLDALQASNGNRRKSTTTIPLKSILKPTVPVSPIRQIPSFDGSRKRNSSRSPSPSKSRQGTNSTDRPAEEGLLIDFSTPTRAPVTGTDQLDNPFDAFNASSAIRDAKEREEREKRERERQAALEHRDARRKSMANRRVSFAPEATLHTWNVVELGDDSTSSSASNSTRRASQVPPHESNHLKPQSSPQREEDEHVSFSPVQHEAQEQSADLSSSPFSGSSVGDSEGTGMTSPAREGEDGSESDSNNDFDGESTAMSMDDVTNGTNAIPQSDGSSTSSSARLNEALRQAAQEAGTKGIEFDENGEMSMEIVDQEITGAFKPWITKANRVSYDMEDLSALQDQENINPFQPQPRSSSNSFDDEDGDIENEDLSVDITNAVGRILGRKSNSRQSMGRRKSMETNYGEKTMEFTNVVGGIAIQPSPTKSKAETNVSENEEMTMEFTSVFGGVIDEPQSDLHVNDETVSEEPDHQFVGIGRDFSEWGPDDEEMDMDFTGAVGGILPPIEEHTEPQDDQTSGMDFTTAMGKILPPGLETDNKLQAKQLMELESDSGQLVSSPFQERIHPSLPELPALHVAPVASESGSPSLASVRTRRTRRSSENRTSTTPTLPSRQTTPLRKPRTPSKQLTPQPARPTTPGKSPPSSNITFRSASPKKLFREEIRASATKSQSPGRSLFEEDATTPAFILRPHPRHSSGLGIDKEGLGSPKVAAMLDRRRSIGEDAQEFVPQEQRPRQLRFEDPVKLHEQVDREREEENREDGHIPVPQENERETTLNLKDLISSLTPKKRKVGNRKSLHVGAAKGLLGKRPAELDEEEEQENSPKRIRGRDASPVKPVKLPAPPSKDETVGRKTRSSTGKLFELSPSKIGSFTPRAQKLVTEMTSLPKGKVSAQEPTAELSSEKDNEESEHLESDWEPIQLQDFLNMTNIHFMELTTTKRRHTTAPSSDQKALERADSGKEVSFEDCVAAGFCTVPMLELYQHSCRELKSYISEGRQIIRSIETETYAENPPLFREYVTARPDIRLLMDNQFRNVKTHARLLSKAMWYEWRMKLLEGLKEGLDRHVEEMKADDAALSKQEQILSDVVPGLLEKHSTLESEAANLQEVVDEMENTDQDELRSARERLAKVEAEVEAKKKKIQDMQDDLQDKIDTIEAGTELKAEFMGQINEAERVKEECRGWSVKEVNILKTSVHVLELQSGWSIISATEPSPASSAGPLLILSYRNELRAKLHPKQFRIVLPDGEPPETMDTTEDNSIATPLELTFCPSKTAPKSSLTPAKSLVLSFLQSTIASVIASTITPKQILHFISSAWDLAMTLEEEIRSLQFTGVTKVTLIDNKHESKLFLRARCILLGEQQQHRSRVDVDFIVSPRVTTISPEENSLGKVELDIDVKSAKVYGFNNNNDQNDGNGAGSGAGLSENDMRDIVLQRQNPSPPSASKKKNNFKSKRNIPAGILSGPTSASKTEEVLGLGKGVWGQGVRDLVGRIFA